MALGLEAVALQALQAVAPEAHPPLGRRGLWALGGLRDHFDPLGPWGLGGLWDLRGGAHVLEAVGLET